MTLTNKMCLVKDKHTTIPERPHHCSYCDKAFFKIGNLVKHEKIHIEANSFRTCWREICILKGKQTGIKVRPHNCNYCDKAFSRIGNLVKHERIHSERKHVTHTGEKLYQCIQCDKAFSNNEHLIVHLRIHTGEKPYKCRFCSKAFSQNINLKSHMKIHTGEKPFKCKVCDKAFLQKINLKYHLRIHTGEKPYKCSICDKAFSQISHINRHQKTHTGEKNFQCSMCDKAFPQNIDLVYHMRTHNGEKPFQCSHCDKAYLHKIGLVTHMKTHNKENSFQCSHCDMAYLHKNQIIAHLRTHSEEKHIKSKSLGYREEENMQPKKLIKSIKKAKKVKYDKIETDKHSYKDHHQLTFTQNMIFKSGNEKEGDILVTKSNSCTKSEKNTKMLQIETINRHENVITQLWVTINMKPELKEYFDMNYGEKIKEETKSTYTHREVERSMMKDTEEHTENGERIQSHSIKLEEINLSDFDEIEEIILSDSDEECEITKSGSLFNKVDTTQKCETMGYILFAIDKAFDWLEESTEGLWKRNHNQIEQDLYDVLQLHKLEIFKDKLYSNIYNLDVNYRQLYLTFSGVDSMVLKHALLCKSKYPKCEDIPHKHKEDMSCCI